MWSGEDYAFFAVDKWVVATDGKLVKGKGKITLQAEQFYEIKLEYFDATGRALARLFWSSPSQAKVIIPESRLFMSASADGLASTEATPLPYEEIEEALPASYTLEQNYPNPFYSSEQARTATITGSVALEFAFFPADTPYGPAAAI